MLTAILISAVLSVAIVAAALARRPRDVRPSETTSWPDQRGASPPALVAEPGQLHYPTQTERPPNRGQIAVLSGDTESLMYTLQAAERIPGGSGLYGPTCVIDGNTRRMEACLRDTPDCFKPSLTVGSFPNYPVG